VNSLVRTPDDLSEILGIRALSAPRPKKRAAERGRTYCFRQYLMTLAAHGLLRFPLSVPVTKDQYQNPDYLVYCGDLSLIGVEIGEVTLRFGRPRPDEARGQNGVADLEHEVHRGGAENRWCDLIGRTIAKKLSLLSKDHVVHARAYDILIHATTAPDARIDFRHACEALSRSVAAPGSIFRRGVRYPVRVHILGGDSLYFDAFGAGRFLACVERSEQSLGEPRVAARVEGGL
jgi:hypothetical protein